MRHTDGDYWCSRVVVISKMRNEMTHSNRLHTYNKHNYRNAHLMSCFQLIAIIFWRIVLNHFI